MRRRWLAIAVILTVASGCDNVKWGGADLRLEPPSGRASEEGAQAPKPDSGASHVPSHEAARPILLAGQRDGSKATLVLVGAIAGDSLVPLSSDTASNGPDALAGRFPGPGSRVALFSEGVRVGHLMVSDTGRTAGYCAPRRTVSGVVELVPSAAGAERFLAIVGAAARPYGTYEVLHDSYTQRVASLTMASGAIRQVGATWPSSLVRSRADIEVFKLEGARGPSVAATFLYQDSLSTAAPGAGAYALFVMGSRRDTTYRSDFVWYRKVATDGKGAPRYFDHVDLDGDGHDEVLLDVFGSGARWFALLGRRDGAWARTFEDRCVRPGSASAG